MSVHSKQIIKQNEFVANEIPSGDIDGFNTTFILNYTPIDGTVIVRLSGLGQVPGLTKDYTINGTTITFNKPPRIGQEVVADYFK